MENWNWHKITLKLFVAYLLNLQMFDVMSHLFKHPLPLVVMMCNIIYGRPHSKSISFSYCTTNSNDDGTQEKITAVEKEAVALSTVADY